MVRIATRFIVKPGELFGTFRGTEWNEPVHKIVTETPDTARARASLAEHWRRTCLLSTSAALHVRRKFPFCRVKHHATVRTVHLAHDGTPNKNKHDKIEVCVLLRPDWATLRYGTPKGEQYDEEATWIEFQPIEYVVSLRGMFIQWFTRHAHSP